MALPSQYLTSVKNLEAILNAIKTAQAPEKFIQRFLETLGFTSSSDRLITGVLKALRFLDDSSQPTERYFRFLDQTQSGRVLAEGIREAYADLFQIRVDAQNLSGEELVNKLKTLTEGKPSKSVLSKMAMTFSSLVKHADFSAPPLPQAAPAKKKEDVKGDKISGKTSVIRPTVDLGGLVYNIQIVLPESRNGEVYDVLFKSLKEHLL